MWRSWYTQSPLCVWFHRKHDSLLALHVLGLGFLLFWVCGWQLEEGKAPFLSAGALGHQVEQLQGSAQIFMHRQLLLHLDVTHTVGEG